MLTLLIIVIVLALAFDMINGFHDAANSIATVVSTKGDDLTYTIFEELHKTFITPFDRVS